MRCFGVALGQTGARQQQVRLGEVAHVVGLGERPHGQLGTLPRFVVQAGDHHHLAAIRGQDAGASAGVPDLGVEPVGAFERCQRRDDVAAAAGDEATVVGGPTGEEELTVRQRQLLGDLRVAQCPFGVALVHEHDRAIAPDARLEHPVVADLDDASARV